MFRLCSSRASGRGSITSDWFAASCTSPRRELKGTRIDIHRLDVLSEKSVAAVVAQLCRIDVLFNCAGDYDKARAAFIARQPIRAHRPTVSFYRSSTSNQH